MLADVPALAEHFRVVYRASTELQYLARYGGPSSRMASNRLGRIGAGCMPYSSWLAEVTLHLADLMNLSCAQASVALDGQGGLSAPVMGGGHGRT